MTRRHRAHWSEVGADRFWSGEAFQSAEEDEQELAYHLSQLIVRSLLSERPKQFFAFATACAAQGSEAAALEHLGSSLNGLAAPWTGDPDGDDDQAR